MAILVAKGKGNIIQSDMKILHITNNFGSVHYNLFKEQIKQGQKIDVFHYSVQCNKPCENIPNYGRVYVSPCIIRGPFLYHYRLQYIRKKVIQLYGGDHDIQLIHGHMAFSDGDVALELSKVLNVPYVVTIRASDLSQWFIWEFIWNRQRAYKILMNAAAIVFLSPVVRDRLLSRLPGTLRSEVLNKSQIIPNGVEKFWHEHQRLKQDAPAGNKINLITVGRVEKNKNQLAVYRAKLDLERRGYNCNYKIIGDIVDKNIEEILKMDESVTMLPFSNKEVILREYRKSDIYIMPSFKETFGLTYVEAMSQGLPVIYTRGQGFDGHFAEGVVGYSVEANSVEDIANRIVDILENYKIISSNATKFSATFNWNNIVSKWIDLYNKVNST